MKRLLIAAAFTLFSSFVTGAIYVLAGCGDTWQSSGADTVSDPTPTYRQTVATSIKKHWRIFWTDGYERSDAQVSGSGQNYGWYFYTRSCPAQFYEPHWETNDNGKGDWVQVVQNRKVLVDSDTCGTVSFNDIYHRHNCATGVAGGCNGLPDFSQYPTTGCASGFMNNGGTCTRSSAFAAQCNRFGGYDPETCACSGGCDGACSPVVIDTSGNGFVLTNALNGVNFDVDGDGVAERRAWTTADSDEAWLVLDRNGNGVIDGGKELFGSVAPQPPLPAGVEYNGFNALSMYDEQGFGGNADGWINQQDAIFSSLRLWQDANHNGVSEASELKTLPALGLRRIDLDYRESRRVDQHGNQFKYRAKVRDAQGAQLGRWAWDVFLVGEP